MWKWAETFSDDSTISSPPYNKEAGPTQAAKSRDTPLELIIRIFLDELVDVVTETNVYAAQNGFNVTFTKEDILGYLGMNIAMGIVGLPELQDYWTREPLHVPWFPSVMSSKKFKGISCFRA